ncbi:hypothetical protein DFH08DRAFT_824451 [Mycena albidolilacea]|uniref:Uncharacterized protein n=1 Tax=Mycena albidolilacea TaxID=1033008 RepID=A0AAD6Z4Q9_9AGAR|nr:hypothetical protein DFH08DRAFT_824451 [Mycena albidolilacea]
MRVAPLPPDFLLLEFLSNCELLGSQLTQHSTAPVQPPSTTAVISELNKDLATLALDEPSDSTERIFDESLGDEEDEGDNYVNADVAQKETEELEAKALSENHQWLKTTLAQIVRPQDPVFVLKHAAVSGFSPNELYLLPIFVWLPHYFPGRPDSFNCECGAKLILHGYNDNPIARCVSTLAGQDYFLLTNPFLCPLRCVNDKGCGKHYQGSDPWIIRQLPEFVNVHGGLDMSELDVMKATFAGHFGTDPFSKMMHELKMLHHDRLETMYYCTAMHFGLRGPKQVPVFSKFENPLGYAGYAPSRQYFKTMFTAWFSVHHSLIDRVMSSLSATIIKADHTYKSFPPLCEVYERMQVELQRHGHPPTQLLYTDDPQAERKFHESVNVSLCENVQHIVLNPFSSLPPFKQSNIPIDYFSSQTAIDSACDEILVVLSSLASTEPLILSLSVKSTSETLHFIQLCSSNKAYVFRVTQIKSESQVPVCLLALLTNKRIVKIGNQIRQSMQSISTAWSIPGLACIDSSSVIDLAHVARVKGAVSDTSSSLPTLAGTVLKQSLLDLTYLLTPDWNGEVKEDDIKILALEVDCVSQIYERLMKIDSVGLPLQESQICAGQPVMLVIGKPPAEGELVAHNGSWPSPADGRQMKISTASTVIKLTKLLVPGHTIARHKQTLQWLMDHGEHAVVQIRTLCTRSLTPPHPSNYDASLGDPAPMNPPLEDSSRSEARSMALPVPSHSTHSREDDIDMSDANKDDHNHDTLEDDDPELTDHEQVVIDAIRHAQEIISASSHKKTLQWMSSHATLYMGSNTKILAPIQELLGDASRLAIVLPAIPLEPEQVDFNADAAVGVDLELFNPMAIRRHVAEELRSDAHFDVVMPSEDDPPQTSLAPPHSPPANPPLSTQAQQQTVFRFEGTPDPSLTVEPPLKKARTGPGPGKGRHAREDECAYKESVKRCHDAPIHTALVHKARECTKRRPIMAEKEKTRRPRRVPRPVRFQGQMQRCCDYELKHAERDL